ncbi:hypothetical protein OQJ15_11915 [Fluoribacter dumoffii]|uniref:Uncharacterized protein n=1 Tax=Fluoribacter dumoffii TaxID=463 RepID=A0A377G746_9GAMM|nr:hypothetical protein [Fluoribacter dumoffii]KTC92437.1 hypothetical protein Ldum_0243 [Fluoribacter dumoffii NY 23]MCW8387013.1 hypothetical protein [Fluoribacter dumoffii]MCW8497216.1 hypothetical protein [Fluoribacter dumoffii]STO20331.1 Uncharacterised protein [Fluoribacter dumoffii]
MFKLIFIVLFSFAVTAVSTETDYCQQALDSLYAKQGDIISVIKIHTHKTALYSSSVETSTDCQNYTPLFSVKNPDVIKTRGGFCSVLPADELKPGLCSLHLKLCISEQECKNLIIKLTAEKNQYIHADPEYLEINFKP